MANKCGDVVFCRLWKWTVPAAGGCMVTLEQVEPMAQRLAGLVEMLRGQGGGRPYPH